MHDVVSSRLDAGHKSLDSRPSPLRAAPLGGPRVWQNESPGNYSSKTTMTEQAVYTFGVLDRKTGAVVTDLRMATPEAIRRHKGIAQLESKQLVGPQEINADGFRICTEPICHPDTPVSPQPQTEAASASAQVVSSSVPPGA